MKLTRRAFCFAGKNQADLTAVLNEVSGFKAVKLVKSEVNPKIAKEIFASNKSIICTDPSVAQFVPTVFIQVNDATALHNISTTSSISIRAQFEQIAEKNNIDIGDHRSNSTKEGPSQNPMDCVFCRYIAGHPDHYQPSIYETDKFILLGNTGHFILGSLLIIPKAHIMSFAELNQEDLEELLEVINDAKYLLKKIFGTDVLLWENGSGSGGHGKDKSSIVHAHIHMNPCDMNILEVSTNHGIVPKPIDIHELYKYQDESYLLIQDYDESWYIVSDPGLYIPRQYVRQLVAEHIDLPGDLWNWRKYLYLENVIITTEIIRKYLNVRKDTLPARIVERTKHFL